VGNGGGCLYSSDREKTNANATVGYVHDSALFKRFYMLAKDGAQMVVDPFGTHVAQMCSIMAKTFEKGHSMWADAHVCQESHAGRGSRVCTASSASHAAYCSA
jgi:hypothetical protein